MRNFREGLLNSDTFNTNLLTPIRIAIGVTFMYHGSILWDSEAMKAFSFIWGDSFNIPFPFYGIYMAKIAQFFGGSFMLLGLFTSYASTLIALTMFVATFVAHKGIILNIPALHYITSGEGETAFVYLLLYSVFKIVGPGKFSMVNKFFNKY